MENLIFTVVLLVPLIFVLWLANMADRRRGSQAVPSANAPGTAPDVPAAADGPFVVIEGVPGDGGMAAGGGPGETWVAEPAAPEAPPAGAAPQAASSDLGTLLAGFAYVILILLYLGLMVFGLLAQVVGGLAQGSSAYAENLRASGVNPATLASFSQLGPTLWLPALLGIILLLRPVRRLAARLIPIDPTRTVHAVALSYVVLVIVNLASTVVLLPELANLPGQQLAGAGANASSLWAQDILFALMAVIGVGWLSRRSFSAALKRLALFRPSWQQVLLGVGVGLAMIPVVVAIQALATALGIPQDANAEKVSQALMGPLTQSIPGILTIGLAAALGEETVFRGALQPRFGLVFTALLFAAMHGTYSISLSSLVVLILGVVLGIVRNRANTSTTMIIHAVYNMSLGVLAYLNIMK